MKNAIHTIRTYYPQLIPQIREHAPRETLYVVTDDAFAGEAQIWTEADRDELLAQYARSAVAVSVEIKRRHNGWDGADETYEEALARLRRDFDASREIYAITPEDFSAPRYTVIDRDTGERFSTVDYFSRDHAERRRNELVIKYGKQFCLGVAVIDPEGHLVDIEVAERLFPQLLEAR
jgi:hypothetical protein